MEIRLDRGGFRLLDASNFRAFKLVDASGFDQARVAALVSAIGRLEPDGSHAWLRRASIVGLLAPPPSGEWLEKFDRMIEGARKFGWVDDDRDMIRAHVDRAAAGA
ncbi:MAG: hypothetical protein JNM30_10060 [Rhodospirillales bacterium]|nr:hypothetical protein [Rhodospirillales bacterium]